MITKNSFKYTAMNSANVMWIKHHKIQNSATHLVQTEKLGVVRTLWVHWWVAHWCLKKGT